MPFRSPAGIDLFRYAEEQARRRRAHPTDDVISHLLAPMVDGDHLTDQEFNNFFTLLVAAGNDTTRYTMAQGMLALMEHPEQLAALRDGTIDMDTAVEEILRWGTVTMHFRRTATARHRAGRPRRPRRRQGGRSGSSRPTSTTRSSPTRTASTSGRTPNDHVAFGRLSPHLCLGAQLARMELKVLYEELLPRAGRHPPGRPGRAAALQLHQRHQAPARRGRLGVGASRVASTRRPRQPLQPPGLHARPPAAAPGAGTTARRSRPGRRTGCRSRRPPPTPSGSG